MINAWRYYNSYLYRMFTESHDDQQPLVFDITNVHNVRVGKEKNTFRYIGTGGNLSSIAVTLLSYKVDF